MTKSNRTMAAAATAAATAAAIVAASAYLYRRRSKRTKKRREDERNRLIWEECRDPGLRRAFPMYVLPVKTVLEMDALLPHEELVARGLLVEYDGTTAGGEVLFCSHTWLRNDRPDDSDGVKFDLLKKVLSNIVSGRQHDVWYHYCADKYYPTNKPVVTGRRLRDALSDGYVWIDYASIPQSKKAHLGGNQALAISSIASYVAESHHFFVLAGAWTHEDDGSTRDIRAWLGRGWCRAEMLANALSPLPKPLVVCEAANTIMSHIPTGYVGHNFLSSTVGRGQFTFDSDKGALGPLIDKMIRSRKEYALRTGDLMYYRLLHATTARLMEGLPRSEGEGTDEAFDDWLRSMKFDDADWFAPSGWTVLRYAVLTGRIDYVQEVFARVATVDVEAPLADNYQTGDAPKAMTILHCACRYGASNEDDPADVELVQFLLERGADPQRADLGVGNNAVVSAGMGGKGRVISHLLRTRPDSLVCPGVPGFYSRGVLSPLHTVPEYGYYDGDLLRSLTKEFPDIIRSHMELTAFGCGFLHWAVFQIGSVASAEAVIDCARALGVPDSVTFGSHPITCPECLANLGPLARRTGVPRLLLALGLMPEQPQGAVGCFQYGLFEATPLHLAAYAANLNCVRLMIRCGADVDSTGHARGMTPLMLAAMGGHAEVAFELMSAGANPRVRDKLGRTARDWAKRFGHEELFKKPSKKLGQDDRRKPIRRGSSMLSDTDESAVFFLQEAEEGE